MLSNVEIEMPGAIDLNLNCKTADEVRQWAVRRTRTSSSGGKKKRLVTQCSKGDELGVDEEPRRIEEIPISSSAKISANTLGQHFNDPLEIVPIKKRRFLFVRSPSPMRSSYSDDYDTLFERKLAAYHEPLAYDKDHDRKFIANKRTSHVIEEVSEAADFSGISILAAAACNSEMVDDGVDLSSLLPKGNSYDNVLRENPNDGKSHSLCEHKERQLQCYEDLSKNNANMETCSAFNSSQDNKSSTGSSLSRLHWDLNIGMDAWNSNCDDLVPEPPVVTDNGGKSSKPNEKLEGNGTCPCGVENDKNTCSPELDESFVNVDGITGDKRIALESLAKPEIGNVFCVSDDGKNCSFPNGNSLIKECHLESTAVSLVNYAGKTKLAHDLGNYTCSDEVISSTTGDVLGISLDGSLAIESINKAQTKTNSGLEVKTETTLSSENVIGDINADAYKSHLNFLQSLSKPICDENANIILSSTENRSADHFSTDSEEKPVRLCSTKIEKHRVLSPDAVSGDQSLLDEDICRNLVTVPDMSGKTIPSDGHLDINNHTDKSSGEKCRSPSLLNAHQCNGPSQCDPDPDELTSGDTCAAKHENAAEDLKVEDDYAAGLKAAISISSVTAVAKTDVNLVTEAVGTQEAGKSNMDSCGQTLIASKVDLVQDTALEKVDLQGDDDSQFEDGEFRESVLHSWEEDGGDEVESEHVDYGSDNEENDVIEAVSAIAASDSFTIENIAFKERYLGDADEAHTGKDRQVTLSQPLSKHSSKSDGPDGGQQKRTTEDVVTGHANQSALNLRRKKNVIGLHSEGDNNREPSADVRTKSSGWDQLPEGRRHTAHFLLDRGIGSVKQDDASDSFRVFGDGESLRRSGLTFRVGLSSRVDGLKSLDNKPYRKDKFYTRLSRYGHDGLEAKAEKNFGAPNSVGWGRSLRHTQKRGRDEHWSDSPSCHGPTHHVLPGYYDSKNYAQPTSRNAAAAAVAKVESNGFVVAPDGTLVKASGAGSAGRVPKRSANAFLQTAHPSLSRWGVQTDRDHPFRVLRRLQNSRELSPDRQFSFGVGQDGNYAHDMDSSQGGRRMPCDRMESPLAVHRLSRRNRSFSPSRRPPHLPHSHTTSPSRSRTRSPLPRTSPRGRSDFGMNDVPVFHRRNRSPISRMERERSPSSQPCFDDRIMVCGSASGNLASPSHASRCIDDRKDASNHLREHRYKRYSKRSPPAEVFSNRRFDSVDSQGRPNPDDYHSLQSRRKTEFNYDGNNDRRGHGGKYELLHSIRQYECTNNEKRSTRF